MDALTQAFVAQSTFFLVIEIASVAYLLAAAVEAIWDRLTQARASLRQTFANVGVGLVYIVLESTVYGLVLVIALYSAEQFAPWAIGMSWWSWLLVVIAADFSYYWMHRAEHRVRVLWAYHSVHHSSAEFNLSTALRLSWVEGLIEWIFFVPMVLAGFSTVQTVAALLLVVSYQNWIHTEKIGRLGWLDRILNTPSVHRVHHGSNPHYHDRNFGGLLIVWDRLFGTYCAERDKVEYGITRPVPSVNPLVINFTEYAALWRDLRRSRSATRALAYLFRPPGWQAGKNSYSHSSSIG